MTNQVSNTFSQTALIWLCVGFLLAVQVSYWFGWTEAEQHHLTAAVCPNPDEIAYAKVTRQPLDTAGCPR